MVCEWRIERRAGWRCDAKCAATGVEAVAATVAVGTGGRVAEVCEEDGEAAEGVLLAL